MTVPNFALHSLIFQDKPAELKKVVGPLVDLNGNFRGQTPLTLAIQLGRKECIQILLGAGCSTLSRNKLGWTPFHEAVSLGDRDIMKMVYKAKRAEYAKWIDEKGKLLLNEIHQDLQDITFEMNWSFSSFIPFVSSLCPSDTYRVFKKGTNLRIDTSLVGYENLTWIRGNISTIFIGDEKDAKLVIVDREQKRVQQIWPRDFSIDDEALEEDISVALNTPINASPTIDWGSFSFSRAKSGFFGFKYDKNEVIEGFPTKVWNVDSLSLSMPVRKEHLSANPLPGYILKEKELEKIKVQEELKRKEKEAAKKASKPVSKFVVTNPESESESEDDATYTLKELEIQEQIKNYKPGYRNISDVRDDEWTEAKKVFQDYTAFRPSLDPPSADRLPTLEKFLEEDSDIYLGRELMEESNRQSFNATLWMYEPQGHDSDLETLPLTPKRLVPLLDLLGMGNEHIRSFNSFIDQTLPPGFPVQVDIPIGMLPLSARVKFQNIRKECDEDDSWFKIPSEADGFVAAEIITSKE